MKWRVGLITAGALLVLARVRRWRALRAPCTPSRAATAPSPCAFSDPCEIQNAVETVAQAGTR